MEEKKILHVNKLGLGLHILETNYLNYNHIPFAERARKKSTLLEFSLLLAFSLSLFSVQITIVAVFQPSPFLALRVNVINRIIRRAS